MITERQPVLRSAILHPPASRLIPFVNTRRGAGGAGGAGGARGASHTNNLHSRSSFTRFSSRTTHHAAERLVHRWTRIVSHIRSCHAHMTACHCLMGRCRQNPHLYLQAAGWDTGPTTRVDTSPYLSSSLWLSNGNLTSERDRLRASAYKLDCYRGPDEIHRL